VVGGVVVIGGGELTGAAPSADDVLSPTTVLRVVEVVELNRWTASVGNSDIVSKERIIYQRATKR
jgi:hypothetical protein